MPNVIEPGTIACEPDTLAGDIFAAFSALIAPADLPQVEIALKRIAFSVASGWVTNVVDSITDTKYLQVNAGEIVGGDGGGGGGGAPVDAEYLVGASDGTLTAKRVVTNTASVAWDLATPGQAKASVPDATTTAKGIVELATSGENAAGVVVQGNDARLSDARTPTAHASTHENGGGDEISVAGLSGLLADPQTPTDHAATHGLGAGDELDVTALGGYSGDASQVLSGIGTWVSAPAVIPEISLAYEEIEIDTTLAIVSGVGQVLVTSSVLPEGWAGSAFWEYTGSGGTLAFPHTGYSRSGRARMTRASGGSLIVTSVGATTAGSVTFSYSASAVSNALQISVTISNTSNWRFRGWLRLYGQVVPV